MSSLSTLIPNTPCESLRDIQEARTLENKIEDLMTEDFLNEERLSRSARMAGILQGEHVRVIRNIESYARFQVTGSSSVSTMGIYHARNNMIIFFYYIRNELYIQKCAPTEGVFYIQESEVLEGLERKDEIYSCNLFNWFTGNIVVERF